MTILALGPPSLWGGFLVVKHTKLNKLLFLREICDTQEQTGGLCWQPPATQEFKQEGTTVCAVPHRLLTANSYLLPVPPSLLVPGNNQTLQNKKGLRAPRQG